MKLHHPVVGAALVGAAPAGGASARRALLQGLLAVAVSPLLVLPVRAGANAAQAVRGRPLLGTWVTIDLAEPDHPAAARALDAAFGAMQRLERLLSHHDPRSALSALNRAAGRGPQPVAPELLRMLQQAQQAARRTDGRFDPTVGRLTRGVDGIADGERPSEQQVREARAHIGHGRLHLDVARQQAWISDRATRIDLGGVAKLPILQAGLDVLRSYGLRGVLVNGGGDVLATPRADGRDWRIGIRDPAAPDKLLAVLPLRAGVVASSGDYERFVDHGGRRYHHIVDPASGRPSCGLHGVTLVAPTLDAVNALGAAAMVAGPAQAGAMLERCGVAQALLVAEDTRVQCTPELARRLQPAPARVAVRGLG